MNGNHTNLHMFSNAQDVQIHSGNFQINNVTNHTGEGAIKAGLNLLQERIAAGAFHDSEERFDPPKCHPRTREAVIEKIRGWVNDRSKQSYFMWLYGPAGAGKSAIAQTIAELCTEVEELAGSFFFSRNADDRNVETFFISTIVYQLTLSIPEIRPAVGLTMENDPKLLARSLKAQAKALITKPMNDLASTEQGRQVLHGRPRFIIVDGLDECRSAESQQYVLDVLAGIAKELTVPLYFLIASRPEQHIREAFADDPLLTLTVPLNLDDSYQPDADIKRFLESKFGDIRRKHPQKLYLPIPWPTEEDLTNLVNKSSGQFIYASTVAKYVESKKHSPPERLQIVFGLTTNPSKDSPFAELDALYKHIFKTVENIEKVTDVLNFLLLHPLPANTQKMATIGQYLFYKPGEIDLIVGDLHSIIAVPPPGDSDAELRFFHASMSDFLVDPARSEKFFIKQDEAYTKVLLLTLKHMRAPSDELDSKIVHETFTRCYSKANPTTELLKALYDFDIYEHFDARFSLGNGDSWGEVPRLLAWLKGKQHPDYEKDLLDYNLGNIERFLRAKLVPWPKGVAISLDLENSATPVGTLKFS
ncbi:hypothetical protein CVT26_004722 [Gymnopilus dilepis]|uniref:Nephrocystin 3-like N-terminal domain-containing protein n=1 Tax=Gymnopilus dilepis TaxID=231916 RepID=A0A409XZ82_9AGAR|nr:hypothetical protein CVT26_004722 [Gymnopilus dilepis]